jgi:dihydrodipicolinate synthase/N-acetylneuraminate lyase
MQNDSSEALRHPPCILGACCLPWNEDHSLAETVFRKSVRKLLSSLTRHLYVFGTAGEGHAVTRTQFEQVCQIFHEEMSGPDAHPMVGVISLSQMEILERIEFARGLGFRSFQISLPSWGALTPAESRRFFRDVCGSFPDCQFLHYNLMRTKRLVTPEEYTVLADENPNLVATKNSTADMGRIAGLLHHAPQLTHFFTEAGYAYGALVGRCGFLVSIASCNFAGARSYYEAGQRREADGLWERQRELMRLIDDLVALGSAEAHMDGAYDQAFCRLHDPEFPLRMLPPYASLSEGTFEKFRKLLQEKYHSWQP